MHFCLWQIFYASFAFVCRCYEPGNNFWQLLWYLLWYNIILWYIFSSFISWLAYFRLFLWQIFLASIAFVADFMCQGITCGICYDITYFVAYFKLITNLCSRFFAYRFCLWQIFRSLIACVADFMHQDIICGTFYGWFFHEIWKMLPTEYPNWHFWLKLAFSSVTCRISHKSTDFFSWWANYTDPNLPQEEPWWWW